MSIEAMKQALDVFGGNDWHEEIVSSDWADKANQAITALRQALEQSTEQEPVAFPRNVKEYDEDWIIDPAFISRVKHSIDPETPCNFTPTMEQVEATLLALEVIPASLFTSPPQPQEATRKPLTDDEIQLIANRFQANTNTGHTFYAVVRAIEAAHGIKGEA